MKYFRYLSRMVVGVVFIFSGFVKAVDPLGYAYKIGDYFTAFRLGLFDFTALPIAMVVSCMELVLGMVLLLGYRKKASYWVLMIFMSFFTVLTFVLAIFNPVHDCGCFGDALILTNWQTFFKNLVLMVFVLPLFMDRNKAAEGGKLILEWSIVAVLYLGSIIFSFWNYRHIPLLDFRPYKVGTVIADDMAIPEDAPVDEYETTLVYKNLASGKEKVFGMENYPKDTTAWEFVSSESRLVKKGYEAPIHDFALMDEYGDDLVDQILNDPGYTLLMISYDLDKADGEALVNAGQWADVGLLCDNYTFHAVTASTTQKVEAYRENLGLAYDFLAADEIMLKTIVRSSPGYMLIWNGVILSKWSYRDFPALEEMGPDVMRLMENASSPMDEETQMLMEAGVMEDFSFSVLDFSALIPDLVLKPGLNQRERGVVYAFILGLLFLLALSHGLRRIE